MVDQSHADAERVSEVHRGHRSKRVDVFATHPNTLRVVVADSVKEAILRWKETWWHTRVEDEGHEGAEVGEGHGATSYSKGVE